MSKNNPGASLVAQLIPQWSVGVEIGVWEGASSLEFAEKTRILHLVDPWPGRDDQYQRVKQRFADRPAANPERPVTIHRMKSAEFFRTFTGKVDWVYIDGLHDYESVKADLLGASKILKPGGVIYGDDYGKKGGVQQAVDEFAPHRRLLGMSQYAIP